MLLIPLLNWITIHFPFLISPMLNYCIGSWNKLSCRYNSKRFTWTQYNCSVDEEILLQEEKFYNTLPGPSILFCGGISTRGEIHHLSQRIPWTGILLVSQFKAYDRLCSVVYLRSPNLGTRSQRWRSWYLHLQKSEPKVRKQFTTLKIPLVPVLLSNKSEELNLEC